MTKEQLKQRTKKFALRIMAMTDHLPENLKGKTLAGQIIRCATSVAANYRAACRGRSRAEFVAKLGTVLEECDECQFWLELIAEAGLLPPHWVAELTKEADELTAIFFSATKTIKSEK